MRQYDKIALQENAKPKGAVRVEKVKGNSRVPYVFFNEDGKQMCSAKCSDWTPEQPRYCGSTIISPVNHRCTRHGGNSPTGVMCAQYQTGKYSRNLPTRLAAKYQEAQEDPDLHTLNNELMLVDTRLKDLLEQVSEAGSTGIFKTIADAFKAVRAAINSNDEYKLIEANQRLEDAIEKGVKERDVWIDIDKCMDTRRKLVLAEGKRLQLIGALVPVEKVNVMIGFIVALISQRVDDRVIARGLVQDVLKIAGHSDSGVASDVPGVGGRRLLTRGEAVGASEGDD
jgi:hypothetical protein